MSEDDETIGDLLERRKQLQRLTTDMIQDLLFEEQQKMLQVQELKSQLEECITDRNELSANIIASERLPDRLSRLREELQQVHTETEAYKDIIAKQSVTDKKLHKALLLSLEMNRSASKDLDKRAAKERRQSMPASPTKPNAEWKGTSKSRLTPAATSKPNVHKGIVIEEEDRSLSRCLDTIEMRSGTVEKLVEWIAEDKASGSEYFSTFCFTYRSYATSMEILQQWEKTYEKYCESETQFKPERLKMISFLKYWATNHFAHDFSGEKDLRTHFLSLAKGRIAEVDGEVAGKALERVIRRKGEETAGAKKRKATLKKASFLLGADVGTTHPVGDSFKVKPPQPILPSSSEALDVLTVSHIEIARQLTLQDFDYFRKIQPKECLSGNWAKSSSLNLAPNIMGMIGQFNRTCAIVSTSVLSMPTPKLRAQVISAWILIGQVFKSLNNFNGVMEVVAALSGGPVFRLRKSWEKVPRSKLRQYEDLCVLMSADGSSKAYRAFLHSCNPPLVPYLGLYLKDLTFIEDGNPARLDNGQVNFFKCTMIAAQVKELLQYQRLSFNLKRVHAIQVWLEEYPVLTESEQYDQSLVREARKPQ